MRSTFIGHFVQAGETPGEIEVFENHEAVVRTDTGELVYFGPSGAPCTSDAWYCPGFVDAHLHAPQYSNMGVGLDQCLLDWLESVTFPTEDASGQTDYQALVRDLLSRGTTTAVYFGNMRNVENLALLSAVQSLHQRAFIGKVCMDASTHPTYSETLDDSVSQSLFFEPTSLVQPIITPRFALSCTSPAMNALSKLALSKDLFIQTHISESVGEIEALGKLFPGKSYAKVYDEHGLLTCKTLLAHGIHLTDKEYELLKSRDCCLVHCPLSNFALNSGIANVQKWRQKGMRWAIGSDISGGTSLSMRAVMLSAVNASKSLVMTGQIQTALTMEEAFYYATRGGAQCLQLKTGYFAQGNQFDAILVTSVDKRLSLRQKLQRFLYGESTEQISKVFVGGILVSSK